MSETGDFELFSAPAAKEYDEKSDEQFREEMKSAQQAMQQLKKEEGKAKAHDDQLAHIIVQFLSQPGNTDLFLLISRCVAQNIPSEITIAILSLVNRTALDEIEKILKEAGKTALVVPEHAEMHHLKPGQKQAIDEWLRNVTAAAQNKPQRALESLLIKKADAQGQLSGEVAAAPVQLSAFIMRKYLAMQGTQMDYEKLRDFMETVFAKMIKDLELMIQGQAKLETKGKS